jgi:hypothetical protein
VVLFARPGVVGVAGVVAAVVVGAVVAVAVRHLWIRGPPWVRTVIKAVVVVVVAVVVLALAGSAARAATPGFAGGPGSDGVRGNSPLAMSFPPNAGHLRCGVSDRRLTRCGGSQR